MSVVPFIQNNIFGDMSAVLSRKLAELETKAIDRVASYHDWLCLRKSDSFVLTAADEYKISGSDNDLAKVSSMWYGDGEKRLSLLYDEQTFFDQFYGRYSGCPVCCLFLGKTEGYKWKIRIYPIEEGATISYYYQRKITRDDTRLFSHDLVFVNEILGQYWAGDKDTLVLAQRRLDLATLQLEELRKGEYPMIVTERKVVISEDQENFLQDIKTFRSLRQR
jgi:hypothetical protein